MTKNNKHSCLKRVHFHFALLLCWSWSKIQSERLAARITSGLIWAVLFNLLKGVFTAVHIMRITWISLDLPRENENEKVPWYNNPWISGSWLRPTRLSFETQLYTSSGLDACCQLVASPAWCLSQPPATGANRASTVKMRDAARFHESAMKVTHLSAPKLLQWLIHQELFPLQPLVMVGSQSSFCSHY